MRCRLGTGLCSRGAKGGLGFNSHQLGGCLQPAGARWALPRVHHVESLLPSTDVKGNLSAFIEILSSGDDPGCL